MNTPVIITPGKDNGEEMIINYQTSKGTDIFGFGIPNIRTDTDWDLGPTWCYLIIGEKTTLIDTGRFGNFQLFKELLRLINKRPQDIDRIIMTHSHEDHDGNLAALLAKSNAKLWAHRIFQSMISYYPEITNGAVHPEFPGSCRLCRMPSKISDGCLPYHKERSLLKVDYAFDENQGLKQNNLYFIFTPGHSADSLCIMLENEVMFTGDTVLPDITPHPSLADHFESQRRILPEGYDQENNVYGLTIYIKSLYKLMKYSPNAILPAHRLFYNNKFNIIDNCAQRARDIIQFHINRCRSVLEIMDDKPIRIDKIVENYFEPSRLIGVGRKMAYDEILAHIELLEQCGDICWVDDNREMVKNKGSSSYLSTICSFGNNS